MNHPDHNGPPSHPNGGRREVEYMGRSSQPQQHHHQQHPQHHHGQQHHHQHHRPPQHHHHGHHPNQQQNHDERHFQHQGQPGNSDAPPPKWHSYKMLVDPSIHRGASKMMRYDGLVVPGNPHHVPPSLTDPRNKPLTALWRRIEPMDLAVPKFKIDENYVGEPPKVEVTVENMNDNIDEHFLRRLVEKCGLLETVTIYYHPVTGKHLGLAHLCFEEVKSAKECCNFLHGKSVMGQVLSCLMDPLAKSCAKSYTDLTEEKKLEHLPPPAGPSLPLASVIDSISGITGENSKTTDGFSAVDEDRTDVSPIDQNSAASKAADQWDPASGQYQRRRSSQEDPRVKQHQRDQYQQQQLLQQQQQTTGPAEAAAGGLDQHGQQQQPPLPYPNDDRYHPTIFNPNYWQQQAQQYVAMQQPPPPVTSSTGAPTAASALSASSNMPLPSDVMETVSSAEDQLNDDFQDDFNNDEDQAGAKSGGDDESDHQVDLDTRLKLLMKGKAGGAMPSFLLNELNGSEDDDDDDDNNSDKEIQQIMGTGGKNHFEDGINSRSYPNSSMNQNRTYGGQHQQHSNNHHGGQTALLASSDSNLVFIEEPPLSRAPSPFLSESHYLECHGSWQAKRKSEFEKSQQLKLAASKSSPKSDDRMSLSSLSSAENNILEQGVSLQPNYYGYFGAPPPGYDPSGAHQSHHQGWYTQHYMQHPHQQWPPDYNIPHHHQSMMQSYPSYDHQKPWQDPYEVVKESLKSGKSSKNVFRPFIKRAVDEVVQDLTRILTKDIKKRMCETLAFYHFDKWWQEQELKYKQKHSNIVPSSSKSTTVTSVITSTTSNVEKIPTSSSSIKDENNLVKSIAQIPRTEDISKLFDRQRENMGMTKGAPGSSSLGFGFRGSIPKLPAFKKKDVPPSEKLVKSKNKDQVVGDSSDEDNTTSKNKSSKKYSEKRRDQEKRREDRRKEKESKKKSRETDDKSSKKVTLGSIFDSLNFDTDESKDTDDDKVSIKSGQDKKEKKLKKKKKSSPRPEKEKGSSKITSKNNKKVTTTTSSVSSIADSTASSDQEEILSSDEVIVRPSKANNKLTSKKSRENDDNKNNKKAVIKPDVMDESSRGSSSLKKSESSSVSSSSSASSSSSSTSPSGSSSDTASEEPAEADQGRKKPPKPAPVRKASETLLKTDSTSITKEEISPEEAASGTTTSGSPKHKKTRQIADDTSNSDIDQDDEDDMHGSHIDEDHCYARPSSEQKNNQENSENFENQFANDHGYTRPKSPTSKPSAASTSVLKPKVQPQPKVPITPKIKKKITEPIKPEKETTALVQPRKTYKQRATREEFDIIYKFLTKGLDLEDIRYLNTSYHMMLNRQDDVSKMLNYTTWVDHTVTDFPEPPKKKRKFDFSKPHLSGSARTEGYYKMDPREKARTKYHLQRHDGGEQASGLVNMEGGGSAKIQTAQSMSREARSNQRRQLAVLGDIGGESDLLKFNQLKFRRKNLTFGKSSIHDWGLFAREYIGADEMVIEYVGHVVRPVLSDVREKRYEKQGIGSSYLFRIDQDYVVDATKCGNLARFINHSCDPNCYAKIITIDGEKKIVIYSKQPIAYGEEITYDYKFPIEDEKIRCLCATKSCRKYLN